MLPLRVVVVTDALLGRTEWVEYTSHCGKLPPPKRESCACHCTYPSTRAAAGFEVVTDSTKKNLQMRVDAENGATAGKFELAKLAKKYNLDAIHDTVHEMARDEARHGKAFEGLLKRYFNK